jgi:hypothetical protein
VWEVSAIDLVHCREVIYVSEVDIDLDHMFQGGDVVYRHLIADQQNG